MNNNNNNEEEMMLLQEVLTGIVAELVETRLASFAAQLQSQQETIEELHKKIGQVEADQNTMMTSSSSNPRRLQLQQQEDLDNCLPTFVPTTNGNGRCEVYMTTRFQKPTTFNDDVVFKEQVEFDPDASDCLPTYNRTTQMCRYNNNITFDEGNIIFNSTGNYSSVHFENNTTKFHGHTVQFRNETTVRFESDVTFDNQGQVKFNKPTTFTEDMTIANTKHDIDFRIQDRVGIKFATDDDQQFDVRMPTYFHESVVIANEDHAIDFKIEDKVQVVFDVASDHYVEFESWTRFHEDVKLEKKLDVKGDLRARKKARLDDLDVYGYLWVDGRTYLEKELEVRDRVTITNNGSINITNGSLDVHGGVTSNFVVIDGTRGTGHHCDDDHCDDDDDQPNHDPNRGVTPRTVLSVKGGNANIDGTLTADKIRSDNINVEDTTIIDDIIDKLQDSTLNLKVNRIEANTADMGGTFFPLYDDFYDITSDKVVELLENQNLEVKSLVVTETAIIGDQQYPQNNQHQPVTVEDLVKNLMTYPEVVTIPKLESIELKVRSTTLTENGITREVPGQMKFNGDTVATVQDITDVERTRESLSSDSGSDSLSTEDIIAALEGATIKVAAVEASSSLMVADVEVATRDDVTAIVNKAIEDDTNAFSADSSSCTCERSDIENVVTTDYIRDILGDGTTTDCQNCSEEYIRASITSNFIEGLGFSTTSTESSSCVCEINDYETEIKDLINSSYITEMGFLSADGIQDAVNTEYISSICPCGDGV